MGHYVTVCLSPPPEVSHHRLQMSNSRVGLFFLNPGAGSGYEALPYVIFPQFGPYQPHLEMTDWPGFKGYRSDRLSPEEGSRGLQSNAAAGVGLPQGDHSSNTALR